MIKLGQLLIIIICAGVGLSYMGYFDKPEDRVQSFAEAYNRQDVNEIISMLDTPEVNQLKSTLKLTGAISNAIVGIDVVSLLLDFLPLSEDLLGYTGSRMYIETLSSESDLLRTEATVHTKVITEFENNREEENLVFHLKKKDRIWYITDIQ